MDSQEMMVRLMSLNFLLFVDEYDFLSDVYATYLQKV